MAQDTAIKKDKDETSKNRWIRFTPRRPDLPELGNIFDLYWGGPERRITGLTLRIISVNAIALVMLMIGILYLGQYQNRLIENKLENFENEIMLVSDSVSEGAAEEEQQQLSQTKTQAIIARLVARTGHHIIVFNTDGGIITDSEKLNINRSIKTVKPKRELESVRILKNTADFIISLLPESNSLPQYPNITGENATHYPDAQNALDNILSLSVWLNKDKTILLSAAAPLQKNGNNLGAVLIKRKGHDIEQEITQVWIDILKIFLGTLLITTALSIYLSGVIARPLKRLAKAAEAVRKGQSSGADDIPDFSHRFDEIGELSVALKAMTQALWERMDTIEHFAADVAHELKNPLTSLKSALETLDRVTKPEDQKKLMDIIRHDIKRMDRLITDISTASRLDAELSREAFTKTDLKTVLKELTDLYKDPLVTSNKTSQQTQIVFNVNCDGPFDTMGIGSRLGQVFCNLIDNALSFAPKEIQSTLSITLHRRSENIVITIEDEGPGIPDNKLEEIFLRFYSERPQTEGYGNNSGLGLSICKQIIDAHGGEIFAENITGKDAKNENSVHGARFSVILKAA